MAKIEDLEFRITASTGALRTDLQRASQQVQGFASRTQAAFANMQSQITKSLGPLRASLSIFGGIEAVRRIVQFTGAALDAADSIGEISRAVDFSAERFQRLREVFKQGGVGAEEFEGALRTLNTRLGVYLSTGAGPAAEAIKALGLEHDIASGKIRTAEQLFDAVAEGLVKVDSAAKQSAISAAFFGKSAGSQMAEQLRQGAGEINRLAEAVQGVFTDDQVRKADEINDAFATLSNTIGVSFKGAIIDSLYWWRQLLFPTAGEDAAKRIDFLNDEIVRLTTDIDKLSAGGAPGDARAKQIQTLKDMLASYAAELKELQPLEKRLSESPAPNRRAAGGEDDEESGATTGKGQKLSPELETLIGQLEFEDKLRQQQREAIGKGQELSPALGAFIEQAQAAQKLTEAMATDVEKQVVQWRDAQALLAEGLIDPETVQRLQETLLQPIEVKVKRIGTEELEEELKRAKERAEEFADSFASAFESRGIDALLSGDIKGALRGLTKDFAEMIIRLTLLRPLAEGLASSLSGIGGGGGGGVGGFFKSLFGFAGGGRPPVGQPSWVGEGGPELFVPDVAGRILSHEKSTALAGGGGVTVNQVNNINASGGTDVREISSALAENNRRLKAEIAELMRRGRFA